MSVREAWRALRFKDWYVQVLIHWACAFAYGLGTGQAFVPYCAMVGFTTVLVALGMTAGYLLNNVADYRPDAYKAQPYFRTSRGVLFATLLAVFLIVSSLALAHAIAPTLWLPALAWGQLLLGLAYSLPPLRLKERGVLGLLSAASAQRLPGFLMLAAGAPVLDASLAFSIAGWLMVVGLIFILEHQIDDLECDLLSGTRTWVVDVGGARARRLRARFYSLFHFATVTIALLVLARRPTAIGGGGALLWLVASLCLARAVQKHYRRMT